MPSTEAQSARDPKVLIHAPSTSKPRRQSINRSWLTA